MRIKYMEVKQLDEIYAKNVSVHLEALDDDEYFLSIRDGNKTVNLNISGSVNISWIDEKEAN